MRVVLDTNIFVSMLLGGRLGTLNDDWKAEKFVLVVPTDNKFIEAAVAATVDCVVSGDAHLLSLGSFHDIPIITARRFLELLSA